MRTVYLSAALLPLVLFGSACSAAQDDSDTTRTSGQAEGGHGEGGQGGGGHDAGGHGAGGHGGGQHGSHDTDAALNAVLVDADTLPEGYREGHAHAESTAATAPDLDPACAPIAELFGEHPSVRQDEHPQASTSFSKGHFGPELTETVIDYGSQAAAERALGELRRAGDACGTYLHSAAAAGINSYTVGPGRIEHGDREAVTLRLDAVGSDFDGLYWDLWVTRAGDRLVAVGFLNARNGGNEDLHAAIPAVMSALSVS